jgi:hypothetical protein
MFTFLMQVDASFLETPYQQLYVNDRWSLISEPGFRAANRCSGVASRIKLGWVLARLKLINVASPCSVGRR